MRLKTWVATLVSAFAAGALFVLACSDDSPAHVDAATCDATCEPSLAGRIRSFTKTQAVPANSTDSFGAGCPTGGIILGGGCRSPSTVMVMLEGGISRIAGDAFFCSWRNDFAQPLMGTAEAVCLMPPE